VPAGAKWLVPQENWHITLAFYGDVPDGAFPGLAAEAEQACAGFGLEGPPVCRLSGAGMFRGQAGWVGVGGDAAQAAGLMRRLAALWPSDRAAAPRPHLTFARGGRGRPLGDAVRGIVTAMSVYRGPDFPLDQVTLMRSELRQGRSGRSRYIPMAVFALGGERH
jgi:2'-5' RNA ligase